MNSTARVDRGDGRSLDGLRAVQITRNYLGAAPGCVLYESGQTAIVCAASVEENVPPWLEGRGKGWITAEYNMLPGSTDPRKRRERGTKPDGRTTEIQRLVGRSLRAVADLSALGERTITVDCDVLRADGGTRTASITGALIAVVDALDAADGDRAAAAYPLTDTVAAVSVGIVDNSPLLDLDYREDVRAEVDMNVVMTGSGRFVEVQATGEEATFDQRQLDRLLDLARGGIAELIEHQRRVLETAWPWNG